MVTVWLYGVDERTGPTSVLGEAEVCELWGHLQKNRFVPNIAEIALTAINYPAFKYLPRHWTLFLILDELFKHRVIFKSHQDVIRLQVYVARLGHVLLNLTSTYLCE